MKKIYITGICGFVGSNAANKLHESGYEVNGCDSLQFGYAENLNPEIRWEHKSIAAASTSTLNKYDVLLHCATANIIYAQTNPVDTYKTNVLDSINLVERFAGKIIYTSSCSIYGDAKQIPTPEYGEVSTTNAYAQSKYILERFLEKRGDFTSLRLSNVFGINQRPLHPYSGFLGKAIGQALADKPITIFGNGNQSRDYCFVDDAVGAIVRAISQEPKNTAINIASGKETSCKEVATTIFRILDKVQKIDYLPPRSIDNIQRRCLDVSLAKNLLGWEAKTSFSSGVSMTIDWIRNL